MYEAVTRAIRVRVTPAYIEDRSTPADNEFFWAYTVDIVNEGEEAVRLLTRTWRITDGSGRTEEVHGPGVIGQTPLIEPGDSFTYTSGCPLKTPSGIMMGRYQMTTRVGAKFDVAIPAFSLDSPYAIRSVN
jgi:ApaG protein